jgi:hypothetical protein
MEPSPRSGTGHNQPSQTPQQPITSQETVGRRPRVPVPPTHSAGPTNVSCTCESSLSPPAQSPPPPSSFHRQSQGKPATSLSVRSHVFFIHSHTTNCVMGASPIGRFPALNGMQKPPPGRRLNDFPDPKVPENYRGFVHDLRSCS